MKERNIYIYIYSAKYHMLKGAQIDSHVESCTLYRYSFLQKTGWNGESIIGRKVLQSMHRSRILGNASMLLFSFTIGGVATFRIESCITSFIILLSLPYAYRVPYPTEWEYIAAVYVQATMPSILIYPLLRPARPEYSVTVAPEIIAQACVIPLTVATPYPPIAALCKYANTLCDATFPSIDWSQAATEPDVI